MSTAREQLDNIEKKISALNNEQDLIWDKISVLNSSRHELTLAIIEEEKLFDDISWTLNNTYVNSGSIHLECDYDSPAPNQKIKLDKLVSLCFRNGMHHDTFSINDKIDFRLDDYELSLRFSNAIELLKFRKKHKIIVDLSQLNNSINELKQQVSDLTDLLQKFGS